MAKVQRFDQLQHVIMFPNGSAVQIARCTGERIQIEATDSPSEAVPLPEGARLVEIRATEDCYIRFGDETVVATTDHESMLFLRGVQPVAILLDGDNDPLTHVSAVRLGSQNAVVQIERLY